VNVLSGVSSDALLYLGPPDTLTESPIDPTIYLDPSKRSTAALYAACRRWIGIGSWNSNR
jgi:hypothetical protein